MKQTILAVINKIGDFLMQLLRVPAVEVSRGGGQQKESKNYVPPHIVSVSAKKYVRRLDCNCKQKHDKSPNAELKWRRLDHNNIITSNKD